jgi:hypothetical protein
LSVWLAHFLNSFADQAATWFVGAVLALLGLFSSRILEKVKFALNRADLRVKYYEEMATEISRFVFIVDRLARVYYGSRWISPEGKADIAGEYDQLINEISGREYVYLSWLQRYWGQSRATAFAQCMEKIRAVDLVLIRLNDAGETGDERDKLMAELWSAFGGLQEAARTLLLTTI